MKRKFRCIDGCSDCCIYREYYPSTRYGKIGVLLLPEEKEKLEQLAMENDVRVRIVPRIAVGGSGKDGDGDNATPKRIIAYQMMGRQQDGDLCPFLDIEGAARSPHGGLACRIYNDRPLACRAYPVIGTGEGEFEAALDGHCQFCRHHSTAVAPSRGLEQEIEALARIKASVRAESGVSVWRYATATGSERDRSEMLPEGWVPEQES